MVMEPPKPCGTCLCYRGMAPENEVRPVLCVHSSYYAVNTASPKKGHCGHYREKRPITSGSRRKLLA